MASNSILQIVQTVAPALGITKPNTVTGSTDLQVLQLLALANKEGQALAARFPWTELIKEATFTTLAAESQGRIRGTILPNTAGFSYILNDTIMNRTTHYQVGGAITARGWQAYKATTALTGFYSQYRIRGGELLFYPAPAAGNTAAFEYKTENWVQNAAGDEFRSVFTMDNDIPLLDSSLIELGLTWRWKATKGLEFGQDFEDYELAVADARARDEPTGSVSLNGCGRDGFEPGVLVSKGSWNL